MLCSSWLRVHLPLVTALLQSIYLTELCSVDDILQRPHSWNTRGISFNFHTMAPPVEDLLRHHIISTTCRLASVDCWQVAGAAEQLSPRWTHFNYGSGFLPADFTLSRLSTHSDKMGRRATIGVAPAAKETLSKPSKCLSHYTLHWCRNQARETLAHQCLFPVRSNEPGSQRRLADRDG